MRTLVVFASLIVLSAADARAQTVVGGAIGASSQSAGASDIPYLGPPFGGDAVSGVGLIDFHLRGHFTIGGEASLAGPISGTQTQRTGTSSNAFESRHRDSVFSGVLKFGVPLGSRVRAAAAAGAGGAWRSTARSGTTASIFPPSSRQPFNDTLSDFVFAYTFGGDVDVRITDRVSALAIARWHRLRDDDLQSDGVVKRGISSNITRYGAGATWRF
jgi:hypothetical protein